MRPWTLPLLLLGFLLLPGCLHDVLGSKAEFRSINTDEYELIQQKNGRIDILTLTGDRRLANLQPMVQLADAEAPRALEVSAALTQRTSIQDRLGDGQGLVSVSGEAEWYWQTYPGKPFVTVQVSYVNDTKKPVRVARLFPAVAAPGGGIDTIAPAAAAWLLENGRLFTRFDDFPLVLQGEAASQWNLGIYHPGSGMVLTGGFLTSRRAYTEVRVGRTPEALPSRFDQFQAACVYDPPVEVLPGERLESEIFYVGVTEADPLLALERYAKAVAVWNGVREKKPFLPHGWDSWSTRYHNDLSEAAMLTELDALDRRLKRYGWNHFAMDAVWERARGDWYPDPVKFPNGLRPLVDEIHRRGMTAGIWLDPFTVELDTPVAREHPEWLLGPSERGRRLLGENLRVLDVTQPGAYAHVRETCRRISEDWGFDALMEADFTYHLLLVDGYAESGLTRLEVLRRGLEAVREGFGADKFIMTMTPHPVAAEYGNGVRVGRDCAPIWKAASRLTAWGAQDALTNAIRRFYFAPHLYAPDQDVVFFGHDSSRQRWNVADQPRLTSAQSLAWLTGAALTGGVVKVGEPFSELTDGEVDQLRRVLPIPDRPARPLDVFQEGSPRVWHLPMESLAGKWHIVALFNWDTAEAATIPLPFAALGEPDGKYLTVFDFWEGRYYGTAATQLPVRVPPGSVRLLGLRPYESRPMLLASDRHITQGAMDQTAETWDAAARTLTGQMETTGDTPYVLRILAPEGFTPKVATVSSGPVPWSFEDRVLTLRFAVGEAASLEWRVTFE
jgi:hypothetical protein